MKEGLTGITGFHPSREAGKAATELYEHSLTINAVKGILEVQQEGPALLIGKR